MKRRLYGALIYPAFMALMLPGPSCAQTMLPGPSFAQTAHAPAAHPVFSSGQTTEGQNWKLSKETVAADSKDSFDRGNRLLQSSGSLIDAQAAATGLEKMGVSGHLVILDVGTQVKNLGVGSEVRVLAGPHAGQIWWLVNDTDLRKPESVPSGAVVEE
jgi:hypothetical protein